MQARAGIAEKKFVLKGIVDRKFKKIDRQKDRYRKRECLISVGFVYRHF